MAEKISENILYASLCCLAIIVLARGQDQSGFISLDCGLLPENSSYIEQMTGLKYISDKGYIDTGISKSMAPEYRTSTTQNMWYVRSFPEGPRNCYNLVVNSNNKYLIRASFMYGNYDSENKLPEFDLHLGPNKWDTVKLKSATQNEIKEIMHFVSSDFLQVCLVNTGLGTPFMSSLELRPVKNGSYVAESGSLMLFVRLDFGSATNQTIRYEADVYDRIWSPYNAHNLKQVRTSQAILSSDQNSFQPPSIVVMTAATPANASGAIDFLWQPENESLQFYIYMYFAEVQDLKADQLREFQIFLNGQKFYGPFSPDYLRPSVVYAVTPLSARSYQFSIRKTENSTLPPIINGIEVYFANNLSEPPTDQNDSAAIMNIKSIHRGKENWQGDPCVPQVYVWNGVNCSYNNNAPPRIIALNLSYSGLTGEIAPDISRLTALQILDLSNNRLTGPVPDFLSQLQFLRVLNLANNQLGGPLPSELLERTKTGFLSLGISGNSNLCSVNSCGEISQKNQKKNKLPNFVIPLVLSVAGFCVLVTVSAIVIWILKKRTKQVTTSAGPSLRRRDTGSTASSFQRSETGMTGRSLLRIETGMTDADFNGATHDSLVDLEPKNRKFTYSQIVNITNGFERLLDKGGYGKVYHGCMDGQEVTVKMLSPTSSRGYKQLRAEVKHLFRLHHRNLIPLLGYCNEGDKMALVYEHMANGHLKQHLAENSVTMFSWEDRLRIALDVAQGVEYLHNGCKPPIIHRNVKCTNIYLDENFYAKLGGFGLSRAFSAEDGTHLHTAIAGTPGYVDPEYYTSNILTEKSDIYSFGVVLLEIITGKPAILKTQERMHISQWVESIFSLENMEGIVDPRLRGDYDTNSSWKAVELAMSCVSQSRTARPAMSQVVTELKESLKAEVARKENLRTESTDSFETLAVGFGNHPISRLR